MLAAVKEGDTKKLAELIRQDLAFNVNKVLDGFGRTLLHHACAESISSPVVSLLLAHPDINVNVKNKSGEPPLLLGCRHGHTSCVREMLKDSRVKLSDTRSDGYTPLLWTVYGGHLDTIKWWIASGREMDLGKPGDVDETDAIGGAKWYGETEVVALLERFKENPVETRHGVRLELGLLDELAAEMFALVVFVSDGLLQAKNLVDTPAARFFNIARQLPLELQMVLSYRVVGSPKEIIPGGTSEEAFKSLVSFLWSSPFTN